MVHFSIVPVNCEISWLIAFTVREPHASDGASSVPETAVSGAQSEPLSGRVGKGRGQTFFSRAENFHPTLPSLFLLVVFGRSISQNWAVSSPPSVRTSTPSNNCNGNISVRFLFVTRTDTPNHQAAISGIWLLCAALTPNKAAVTNIASRYYYDSLATNLELHGLQCE